MMYTLQALVSTPASVVNMAYGTSLANMSLTNACSQALPFPQLPGVQVLNISTALATNFSFTGNTNWVTTKTQWSNLNFCNVSVEYTHPGYDDLVTTWLLLPDPAEWNGRLSAGGGSGWSAVLGNLLVVPLVADGFATVTTDGGVPYNQLSSSDWALAGNVTGDPDVERLNTFASKALHEMAVIGKAVTKSFFNRSPSRSYFIGCSQGGRQGNMLAQRYPEDFDGIAAIAPAVNWGQLFSSLLWPSQVQREFDHFPPLCETYAVTAAAVQACDAADGLMDGVISDIGCTFDPLTLSGRSYSCNGVNQTYNDKTLNIMKGIWGGTRNAYGESTWYGYGLQANLTSVAGTICPTPGNASSCQPGSFPLSDDWFRYWIAADPNFSYANLTLPEFARLSQLGIQQYDSIIGTREPDIRAFRDAGGKMITWHGLADELIPTKGSIDYHNRVRAVDGTVDDYFRLFLAPGTTHCFPGAGPFPVELVDDLVQWVEQGYAPEQLRAINITNVDPATGKLKGNNTAAHGRPLCLYPQIQHYNGGDPDLLSSWSCIAGEKQYYGEGSQHEQTVIRRR